MSTHQNIVGEIEAFCGRHNMAETTFGRRAVNDGKLVQRLRTGGRMWPETENRVRGFMEAVEASPTHTQGDAA